MGDERLSLEERLDELAEQLRDLTQRLQRVESYLEIPVPKRLEPAATGSAPSEVVDASEELLSWAGRAALFPRLATLCFLLVVALVLRTLTDNGIIDRQLGSFVGMAYAVAIMGTGWWKYRGNNPLAPVFTVCGGILMFTIVAETHARYAALPSLSAYALLLITGGGLAVISYQFRVPSPVMAGTLGMCLAGIAIDYPHPFFPYLAMLLVSANLLGYFASRLQRCSWLRWILLIVTILMMQMWTIRLGMVLARHETPPPELALAWFLPMVGILTIVYPATALLGILLEKTSRISRFDFSLPTINVVWGITAARLVVEGWGGSAQLLGVTGVGYALAHIGVAVWLARRRREGTPGANSFAFAGSVLLALALPLATGKTVITLPLISAWAFGLAYISHVWESGGVRFTSYLLQGYAGGMLAFLLWQAGPATEPVLVGVTAGLLGVVALIHYIWCRSHTRPAESQIFARIDRADHSAVLLFMASLVSGFSMLRVIAYHALKSFPGDLINSFRCTQSVIINLAAIGLIVFAVQRHNKEIRNVAILVTAIGAVKVLLYDLIGTRGIPLVLSVLSFGITAMVVSVLLGHWQRRKKRAAGG